MLWACRCVVGTGPLDCRFPVLTIEIDHEVLEVVYLVHVGRFILFVQIFAKISIQSKIFAHKFIKSLLFKYEIAHLFGQRVCFVIILANTFLNIHKKRHGQVSRQNSFHSLVKELKYCLQWIIDLLWEFKQGGLVSFIGKMELNLNSCLLRTCFCLINKSMLLLNYLILQNLINFMRYLFTTRDREYILTKDCQTSI